MDSKHDIILPWIGWIINIGIISLHWVFKSPVSPEASTPFAMYISYTPYPSRSPQKIPWDVCITLNISLSFPLLFWHFFPPNKRSRFISHVSPSFSVFVPQFSPLSPLNCPVPATAPVAPPSPNPCGACSAAPPRASAAGPWRAWTRRLKQRWYHNHEIIIDNIGKIVDNIGIT